MTWRNVETSEHQKFDRNSEQTPILLEPLYERLDANLQPLKTQKPMLYANITVEGKYQAERLTCAASGGGIMGVSAIDVFAVGSS